ncbi:MAG TPA: NUDIX domain-containing protein [Patescibacteria group bacterium]|nr:NUDIX domain-containing protein [Patescibacteria group bacterium]
MKTRIVVAAIIEKDGKILLGQKPTGKGPYPDSWHLPGGGVNLEDETLEDAMRREIKEETGLDVLKLERDGFDEDYENDKHGELTHYVFLRFNVEPASTDAKANDDLVELKWFPKSKLKDLKLARPLVKHLKEIGTI